MSIIPNESFVRGGIMASDDMSNPGFNVNGADYYPVAKNPFSEATLGAMWPRPEDKVQVQDKDFFDPARNAFVKPDSRRSSDATKKSSANTSSPLPALSDCSDDTSDDEDYSFNQGAQVKPDPSNLTLAGPPQKRAAQGKTSAMPQTSTAKSARSVASRKVARVSAVELWQHISDNFHKMTYEQQVAYAAKSDRIVEGSQEFESEKAESKAVKFFGSMSKNGYAEDEQDDLDDLSGDSEYDQTLAIGSKRKVSARTPSGKHRKASNSTDTSSNNSPRVKDEDSSETSLPLPKSKRPKNDRTHSEAIQDTKHLFVKPESVGLPSYVPIGTIEERYPNPSTDTTQFYTGRYVEREDGVRVDQQEKLVMKIAHPDPKKESKTIWHHVPKDWQDPHTITVLNRWRSQAIKRHTGLKQREKIVRYDYAEREFIRDVVMNDESFKLASTKERPAILTAKLNAKFVGISLSGDQLDAYRQAISDEQRARIKPSKRRAARTKASVASEYSRHINDYSYGRIPDRRLTGWNIENQSEDEDEDASMEDSKISVTDGSSFVAIN